MIMHTGAHVYLEEWGGTVKCDVYSIGTEAIALNVTGGLDYNADDSADYTVKRIEDWLNKSADQSVITLRDRNIDPLSERAKDLIG